MTKPRRQALRATMQAYYDAVLAAAGTTRETVCREAPLAHVPAPMGAAGSRLGNGHAAGPDTRHLHGAAGPPPHAHINSVHDRPVNGTPRSNGNSVFDPTSVLQGIHLDQLRSNGRSHSPEELGHTMTIGEFLPLYERNHVALLRSRRGTSQRVQRYVGQLAAIELGSLTKLQVLDWFHAIGKTDGPHAANHFIEDLHSLYRKPEDWDVYTGKNPADRIKKFPKHSRERFVQSDEMPRLLAALVQESPCAEAYFLCLLLTGARRGEARTMKWTDLDVDRALWHKPTTKTGVPHTVPLPARLVEKLRALPRVNEWVFPSTPNSKNGFQAREWSGTAIEHRWQQIRKRASLLDVRIHDLRRTCASWLAISGENLPVIQRTLNHSSLQSTQVYARLSVAPVRRALDEQADRILGAPPVVAPATNHASQAHEVHEWPG